MKKSILKFFRRLFCRHAFEMESGIPVCRFDDRTKSFVPVHFREWCPKCGATRKMPFANTVPAQ